MSDDLGAENEGFFELLDSALIGLRFKQRKANKIQGDIIAKRVF
ncbi:hypothetical protein [Adlercreutzia rubneri]